jgi:IS605 OrfB family transposase
MQHTIQTRLKLTGVEQAVFSELLDVVGKARRAASRKYWVDGLDPVSLVRWISDNYGLHSRQAQSIQIGLDQVERSWREGLVGRMQLAGKSVAYFTRLVHENSVALADAKLDFHHKPKGRDATSIRISKLKSALFRNRSGLDKANRNLQNAKAELATGRPAVCFGGKELARHRATVGEPNARYATLDDWRSAWKQARDGEAWIVGSGREPMGNLSCRFDSAAKTLTVSLTAVQAQRNLDQLLSKFKKVPSRVKGLLDTKRIVIGQVEFHSKAHKAISDAMANGQPISMRILRRFRKNGEEAIYLHATFDVDSPALSETAKGAIGVEFNGQRCAWVAVDDRGNLTRNNTTSPVGPNGSIAMQVPMLKGCANWSLSSARKGQRIDSMRKSAKSIAEAAKKSTSQISIGAEGFAQRQKELKSSGVSRSLRASDYVAFHSALRRAAEKAGVKIVQVQAGGTCFSKVDTSS